MSVFLEVYRKLGALQVALARLPMDPEAEREAVALELRAEREARSLLADLQACSRVADNPEIGVAVRATLREKALAAELRANCGSRDA